MDMTDEEYLDFVNHLFCERMVDFEFSAEVWKNEENQDGAQTVDAMTVIE